MYDVMLFVQGFCCPLPTENRPICPVGVAHETSSPPDYGCHDCPTDYFCHRDKIYTDKEVRKMTSYLVMFLKRFKGLSVYG